MIGVGLGLSILLAGATSAHGQFFNRGPKPVVFEHAHVLTMTGRELEDAVIITRGGVIEQVGVGVAIPDDARVIDAGGMTVTPGLIDVSSVLGLASPSSNSPVHYAMDAFDPFDMNTFRDAVRNGVTTVYLSPGGGVGVGGRGCVVRFSPRSNGGGAGEAVEGGEALHLDLGSSGGPIGRLHTYNSVWRTFKDALDYRESLETYDEELEEYIEKIKERAEKEAKEEAEGSDKKGKGGNGGMAEVSDDGQRLSLPGDLQEEPPPRRRPRPRPQPEGNGGGGPPAKENGDGDKKDEEEIKKPSQPRPNPAAEVLLRVIDHELPVRIRADRDADILNALQLAHDFDIDIVIEGAAESHLVADALAEAEVSVVLDPYMERSGYRNDVYQRRQADLTRVLDEAGVDWVIGSGGRGANQSRFILFHAQQALSHDTDGSLRALEAVTSDAAAFLGLSDQIGSIGWGRSADLVLWDGDPRSGSAVVDSVYIGGRQVYRRTPVPGIGE